jgi:hypothetical protein
MRTEAVPFEPSRGVADLHTVGVMARTLQLERAPNTNEAYS